MVNHLLNKLNSKDLGDPVYEKLNIMSWLMCFAVRDRLVCGLSRLTETNELVGLMQSELIALGPEIEQKAKVSQPCCHSIRLHCCFEKHYCSEFSWIFPTRFFHPK